MATRNNQPFYKARARYFFIQRKKVARKLGNPRILEIGFHTFRHWKGTTEYDNTKDLLHVKGLLGHRDVNSTMLYINLESSIFQEGRNEDFHVSTAKTVEEASNLVSVGFEFVHEYNGIMIFRKRK